jgi:fatty-acid desaturase
LAWYEVDVNWYAIAALRRLGFAWDVKARNLNTSRGEEEAAQQKIAV